MDQSPAEQLRYGDRTWPLAVPQLRRLARGRRQLNALLCFPAWHARPVVQADVPAETLQEAALLALGRISRSPRRGRRVFHVGRRTSFGARILLALSLSGSRSEFRHRGARNGFGACTRG